MKMHSYMNINGYLSHVHQQAELVFAQLKKATEDVGGWDEALKTAEAEKRRLRDRQTSPTADDRPTNDVPVPSALAGDDTASHEKTNGIATNSTSTLRKRTAAPRALAPLLSVPSTDSTPSLSPASHSNPSQIITTGTQLVPPSSVLKPSPHVLVSHPSPEVSGLAKEYSELESELVGVGPTYVRWPRNISLRSFAEYMIVPTLVYELEYPRTERSVKFFFPPHC